MNNNEGKTVEEMAEEWNLTIRRVQILCKEGRLEGAVKKGHQWLIPSDAKKPDRLRSGPKAREKMAGETK